MLLHRKNRYFFIFQKWENLKISENPYRMKNYQTFHLRQVSGLKLQYWRENFKYRARLRIVVNYVILLHLKSYKMLSDIDFKFFYFVIALECDCDSYVKCTFSVCWLNLNLHSINRIYYLNRTYLDITDNTIIVLLLHSPGSFHLLYLVWWMKFWDCHLCSRL